MITCLCVIYLNNGISDPDFELWRQKTEATKLMVRGKGTREEEEWRGKGRLRERWSDSRMVVDLRHFSGKRGPVTM